MGIFKNKAPKMYFFVDEAGDPVFYNRSGRCIVGEEGCSKILLLGLIKTDNPKILRSSIIDLQSNLANDIYLKKIPSIKKSLRAFHAKDDCPEVREKVFKTIVELDFKAEFIIARKIEKIFRSKHGAKEHTFYDDLIIKLFQNKLHLAEENNIFFATRGDKLRQEPLESAIKAAGFSFQERWGKKIESKNNIFPQSPAGEPCLQIIDYMNWAIQRAIIKKEDRYLKFIEHKISYIVDVYDFDKYPKNYYNSKNIFDTNKISPL